MAKNMGGLAKGASKTMKATVAKKGAAKKVAKKSKASMSKVAGNVKKKVSKLNSANYD